MFFSNEHTKRKHSHSSYCTHIRCKNQWAPVIIDDIHCWVFEHLDLVGAVKAARVRPRFHGRGSCSNARARKSFVTPLVALSEFKDSLPDAICSAPIIKIWIHIKDVKSTVNTSRLWQGDNEGKYPNTFRCCSIACSYKTVISSHGIGLFYSCSLRLGELAASLQLLNRNTANHISPSQANLHEITVIIGFTWTWLKFWSCKRCY